MTTHPEDDIGFLEEAKKRLYDPNNKIEDVRKPFPEPMKQQPPHSWGDTAPLARPATKKKMHFAGIFFTLAFLFFVASVGIAGYFLYFGGNAVSVNKIAIDIQGPTTIAGGDTVPLSLTITNKNSTTIQNATVEITFPDGTRDAADATKSYPRYTENLGTIASGASVTRSIKVVMFGGEGAPLNLPVSFSFETDNSNTVFVKKTSFALAVSSTPLSVSVDAPTQIVSDEPFILTLIARSNATTKMDNVVLTTALPFGFSVASSSLPLVDSSFLIGTLQPGASKKIIIAGSLKGQENEQQAFHFTIGTGKTENDQTLAVSYMTQDTLVTIGAPFISTTISINGNPASTITSGSVQSVSVSYANTLSTSVANTEVDVSISGAAVDYDSIKTSNGFYRSGDHTIVFSKDTDPSLASLAPGASGIGTFTFSTLAPESVPASSSITFSISASGSGVQSGSTHAKTETVKVATVVTFSSSALHSSGQFGNSGPIPPHAGSPTTYTIVWNAQNKGSAIAGGAVSAVLPSYVSYTGVASGGFSFDKGSRTVTWNVGDISQKSTAQGSFQVSITPSTSQKGSAPKLVGQASFSGYDRFAGVQISALADPVTTETPQDPGYTSANGTVQ